MPDCHPRRSGGGPYRYVRFEVLMDARWREGSSGSTPSREDPRNAAVTAACHEIVRYLESLPDDDPRLKLLEDASEGCIRDPDHNEARAARIGFGVDHPRTLRLGSTSTSQGMPAQRDQKEPHLES